MALCYKPPSVVRSPICRRPTPQRPIPLGTRPSISWLRRIGEVSCLGLVVTAVAPSAAASGSLGPLGIALVVAFLVLSLGIHEAAHAWVAYRCGDPTAKELGRMTLNPIPHIDLWMTILLPGLLAFMGAPIFGGAKPVPVNFHRLRSPLRDMALVALAGPASNFLIAIVFAAAWKICIAYGGYEQDSLMALVLQWSFFSNVMLTAFNLIPIPPLDGSRVMTWLLPAPMRHGYMALERFGILLVFLLLYIPQVRALLFQMGDGIMSLIASLTSGIG